MTEAGKGPLQSDIGIRRAEELFFLLAEELTIRLHGNLNFTASVYK